uniref:THIF-type NAD/FAD binding fold domain-containing protein n=1 Tax=Oryza rufipogon TaxID=4529 RepID=A0A0E0R346_ORYRU
MTTGRAPEIDEDLHSRQLAVYGRETMKRLFASNVLVSGLNGLGAEIAKNLVLAGVKSVTLHDDDNVELWDLSSNFFLTEKDVGQNRAQTCVQKLQELNNAVIISTITGDLTKEQLSNFQAKIFMVGSGALGCEFLKNLALMGISCNQNGKLIVTDDDVIEKSNLSRQFLFRDWNIGQPKSTSLDAVVNALDNVTARMYIDSRCVYFQKPLLESGTLGAKCNTQMVIPHLTENYGASRDPPEKQAPMCTVHSFPHNIDHCLTWARSEFEGLLEKTPTEVNAFLSNPGGYATAARTAGDAQARDQLERVIECLEREKCETFQDCITWARLNSGAPFWSAPKRFPRPLEFLTSDPSQLNFILAAAILRAETFGIPIPDWVKNPAKMAEAVDKVIVPDFQPKQGVKIVTDEKATSLSSASVDDAAVIEELIAKLEAISKTLQPGFQMKPIQFEKPTMHL